MARLKVASLFCGCGGMDLGIIGGFSFLNTEYPRSSFDIVYAVDNDEYCTKIYNANFEHKCMVKDVREISPSQMPDFDILIGGFPCQSFSISAQNPPRLGYKDERGMLFFEMVKILKEKKPRAFIAENVKGLLSANKKKAFPMILREFADAGYNFQYYLVNASRFGVPQKRERVIIIGFRDKKDQDNFLFSHYIPSSSVLGDVVDDDENRNESLFFSERAVAGMMAVREKMNKGRAQDLSQPCNTISAHLAKVSLNSTDPVLLVGDRYRRFSCREAARIQSFPDSFLLDVVSTVRQYKAIGNAVPPVMMWHIANSMQRAFEVSDGDYDVLSSKASPQYAFPGLEMAQGCFFEQPASYGD
ncbi:MAG: DNA (cytosine-5-)-methyltransferase [Muribaculaceae bacterium]|nr:DNA (cytosine-5-)-methyltransferase [Muribaculaceae bacterium]